MRFWNFKSIVPNFGKHCGKIVFISCPPLGKLLKLSNKLFWFDCPFNKCERLRKIIVHAFWDPSKWKTLPKSVPEHMKCFCILSQNTGNVPEFSPRTQEIFLHFHQEHRKRFCIFFQNTGNVSAFCPRTQEMFLHFVPEHRKCCCIFSQNTENIPAFSHRFQDSNEIAL